MKLFTKLFFLFLFLAGSTAFSQADRYIDSRDLSVLISAEVDKTAPSITLTWAKNELAIEYQVYRKLSGGDSWGTVIATIDSSLNSYTDANVELDVLYEYQVVAVSEALFDLTFSDSQGGTFDSTVTRTFLGFGYIASGIEKSLDKNKTLLLIVDNTLNADLSTEITRFENDLKAEGWNVKKHEVPRTEIFVPDEVLNVKEIIQTEYDSNPDDLMTVVLLGRVAVPYSGNIVPDGHSNNHLGAWPADIYYGVCSTNPFTDISVNNTAGPREQTINIPGDGKFDQSSITPGAVDVSVGRIDLYNMPAFTDSEVELLRKYLDKNHDFRTGAMEYEYQSLVDDNFKAKSMSEGFATSGWRNFGSLLGAEQIIGNSFTSEADWFTKLGDEESYTYLWAYGTGGGSYTSAGGIGKTDQFTSQDVKAIFTMLFGSYFGDWDVENSFLRAGLCSEPSILTCGWAGRPPWYLHHMAMGYDIGYSVKLSQNNYSHYLPNAYYYNGVNNNASLSVAGVNQVHIALMGDPTLRMYMGEVGEPQNLSGSQSGADPISLSWEAPSDGDVDGYELYRSKYEDGSYNKIHEGIITGTSFEDSDLYEGMLYYKLRAVKLRVTNTGTFYNPGNLIADSVLSTNPNPPSAPLLKLPPDNSKDMPTEIEFEWELTENNATYHIQIATSQDFQADLMLEDNTSRLASSYSDFQPGTDYWWRVNSSNKNGDSPWSEIWKFTTADILKAPNIVMPGDGAKGLNPEVWFNWLNVTGAEYYELQVATDDTFAAGALVVDETNIESTTYNTPEAVLALNTMYYWRLRAVGVAGPGNWTDVRTFVTMDDGGVDEEKYDIHNKYQITHFPEPMNQTAFFNFVLDKYSHVNIEVYNSSGVKVSTLQEGNLPGGNHQIPFDRNYLPAGMYVLKIKADNLVGIEKFIIVD